MNESANLAANAYLKSQNNLQNQQENDIPEDPSTLNPIVMLLDWENTFYKRMENIYESSNLFQNDNFKDLFKELEEMLENGEWRTRLEKRGMAFLSIIRKLVSLYNQGILYYKEDCDRKEHSVDSNRRLQFNYQCPQS